MPFCPRCGKEVSPEANYCPSCGAHLNGNNDLLVNACMHETRHKEMQACIAGIAGLVIFLMDLQPEDVFLYFLEYHSFL